MILILGGLFLIWKSTKELHHKVEGIEEHGPDAGKGKAVLGAILLQIAILDIVFSLDSVITAVGMVDQVSIMIIAVMIAVGFMMIFAGSVSDFISRHPTVKVLALSFLLLIGTTLVCGFARIWGAKVGILANNGVLFSDSSKKAAHFISLCNQNRTPLLFLQNTTGYMIGRSYEMEGITKDGAKMLMAQAGSEVPKFTVITSAAFGAGYYGMCGRAWDPRMIWAWPNVHMGVMGSDQAANTLADVKIAQLRRKGHTPDEAEMAQLRQRVYEKAERESNAYFATSRLWDDGLLAPTDTRNALGMALSAAAHAPIADPHYGIFRF